MDLPEGKTSTVSSKSSEDASEYSLASLNTIDFMDEGAQLDRNGGSKDQTTTDQ